MAGNELKLAVWAHLSLSLTHAGLRADCKKGWRRGVRTEG